MLSESVTLNCTVYGLPAPNITWFDDINDEISNSDQTFINVTHNTDATGLVKVISTLEILHPQNADGGLYHCAADNEVSMPINTTTLLLVLGIV